MTKKQLYFAGAKAALPVLFGFIPVGIAYALMARQAGFTGFETVAMSMSVFAGASQMLAAGMVVQGAGLLTIILATFILNLRHLIMSTCVIRRLKDCPLALRLLAAFGVTDESFAIFTTAEERFASIWYFLGLISVTWSAWVGGSAIGAVATQFMPAALSASFGIALYAMFLGLLIPSVKMNRKLLLLVLLTAVVNSALSRLLPASWALIVSTLACAALGVLFVDENQNPGSDTVQKAGDER